MLKSPIFLASLALATSCSSQAGTVADTLQLQEALLAAKGGETIRLKPGIYGALTIKKAPALRAAVVVKAADPANPPVFIGPVVLRDLSNVVFQGLIFQLAEANNQKQPLVRVYGGRNLGFERSLFQGLQNQAGHYGFGLMADNVQGLSISGNRFTKLNRAVVASRVRQLRATVNDISNIGHDGFSLADVSGELTANLIEDFYPRPGYHPDGIQFHSNKQLAARDVRIQHNLILGHPERRIQGIFMRAGYASDPSQRYQRIEILDNIVAGSMWHGITVSQADDLEIARNKVMHLPGPDRMQARISTLAARGEVHSNQASAFLLNPEVEQSANVRLPPSTAPEVRRIRAQWLARFRKDRGSGQ